MIKSLKQKINKTKRYIKDKNYIIYNRKKEKKTTKIEFQRQRQKEQGKNNKIQRKTK